MGLNKQQLTIEIIQSFSITSGLVDVANALANSIHNYISAAQVTGGSNSSVSIGLNGSINIQNYTENVTGVSPYNASLTSNPTINGNMQGNLVTTSINADLTNFTGRLI